MNKKILGLILLAALIVVPVVAFGADTGSSPSAEDIATNVRSLTVTIGMAIVVIGWIIAGILYLTAMGDPAKVKTAKTAMIAAIIGTVLVVIAVLGYDAIKGLVDGLLKQGTYTAPSNP